MAANVPASPSGRPALGPYSRGLQRGAIGQFIDGRSAHGRFLRAYERMLTEQVGAPTNVERALISRAARLAIFVELMDARSLAKGGMSQRDSAQYLAWSNSLRRCLESLARLSPKAKPTIIDKLRKADARAAEKQAAVLKAAGKTITNINFDGDAQRRAEKAALESKGLKIGELQSAVRAAADRVDAERAAGLKAAHGDDEEETHNAKS